ncbi:MAG: sulfate adenylyltransferase [Thermaerobacter sp.]|nr:sulfate adenylyltransferase [Thermaerobacter sp.]
MSGVTVWFTGLSAAGKTTISRRVADLLEERGVPVERLDGDVVRQSLTRDLGFSSDDRRRNIERVTFVAKVLTRNDVVCLAAFISPLEELRSYARREIGEFLEVYVTAPLSVLVERDTKGLYRKAMQGEIQDFTGVNAPFEEPVHPDLVLQTDVLSVEECAQSVIDLLLRSGYLEASGPERVAAAPRTAAGTLAAREETSAYGGRLVDRQLAGGALQDALARAQSLPKVPLDERSYWDLGLLGIGALSPLEGFMLRKDYETVIESMRLTDGLLWPLPVTLSVGPEHSALREDAEVALTDHSGRIVGLMRVHDRYARDKRKEASLVYGTTDEAHPGVAQLYGQADTALGGPVWLLDHPAAQGGGLALTPRDMRAAIAARGWHSIVAFQTRNPLHRAHEYMIKVALETLDGSILHPLVGATKSDDVPAKTRMESYKVLLEHYFPASRILLSGFPAAMRYAGPREAVFHAIARRNYGCTHFIVGRDHAGVGSYYGTYAAQELVSSLQDEIGIRVLPFENAFYCRACASMATEKTCPHSPEERVTLSGTRVRGMLQQDELPPPEFMRPEVAKVLAQGYRLTRD